MVKTFTIIGIFFFLFLLLPALNLININISRISERYSEIGIRKAFGASSRTLVLQFVMENLLLTVFGGFIGTVVALIAIMLFNNANLVDNLQLSVNYVVLFYCLIVCLAFGFVSGVFPAWRMSRLQIATALKS